MERPWEVGKEEVAEGLPAPVYNHENLSIFVTFDCQQPEWGNWKHHDAVGRSLEAGGQPSSLRGSSFPT